MAGAGLLLSSPFLFFAAFGAAFLVYWLALVHGDGRRASRLRIRHVLLLGFLARICLLPMAPSDDMARCVWEGKVAAAGFDPYQLAPNHEDLAALRDPTWPKINHADIPAVYPPLAEGLFTLLAAVRPSAILFKGAFVLLDLLGLWVLLQALRAAPGGAGDPGSGPGRDTGMDSEKDGRPHQRDRIAGLYFLNPLLILESAGHGHFESLPLLFSLAFLWALRCDRPWAAATCLFLGAAAKVAALALLPVLLLRFGLRRGLPPALAASAALAGWLVAAGAWRNLAHFGAEFRYNDAVPYLLRLSLGWILPPHALAAAALALLTASGLALMVLLRKAEPENQCLAFMGLLLAFSPTIHPWYALWVLPFAAPARSGPWLLLTGTAAAAYWVHARAHVTGKWREIPWLRIPEFVPPLLAWHLEKRRKAGKYFPVGKPMSGVEPS